MKVKSVKLRQFKRFESLDILDLPPARLVILAGPNGTGKSSLLEAFAIWKLAHSVGISWKKNYYLRKGSTKEWNQAVEIDFHTPPIHPKIAFYLRTAYRNDPEFSLSTLTRQNPAAEEKRFTRMIEGDAAVSLNYQRLASNAFEDVFLKEPSSTTVGDFREKVIGELRDSVLRLFPGLKLNSLGNPLENGTFRFDKGNQHGFDYLNLSGGEKSAFDLILDLVVKRRDYNDTVFCIDEPEAHINTRLQGPLLLEMLNLIPDGSQLWVATHSIGMMRKARELYSKNPDDVLFLDFEDVDFDKAVTLVPQKPTRVFWERVLRVALDDLADLVAPSEVVICEGNPVSPVAGKNDEHDARCYAVIFKDQRPEATFVSSGASKAVAADRLKFAAVLPKIAKGISIRRVIDRDDHSPAAVAQFKKDGVRVLRRRNIESYLYDDEILEALYARENRLSDLPAAIAEKAAALAASISRGNAPDDVKSAASDVYRFIKKQLGLTACGNDHLQFARDTLAELVTPQMKIFQELDDDIFGS